MKEEELTIENKNIIEESMERYLKQQEFEPLELPKGKVPEKSLATLKNTAYVIFIRAKFLFLALSEQIEKENSFAAYTLIKAYWETVAILGYLVIRAEYLISTDSYQELHELSRKLALGGKAFPNKEMLKKLRRHDIIDKFQQPNLLTMMKKVDKYWNKNVFKENPRKKSLFEKQYREVIGEAGHPTFLGLSGSGKWLGDGSLLPDITQSWDEHSEVHINNYTALASIVFFYFWEKFLKFEE